MKNVVRVGVFLTDMTNFAAMNKVHCSLRFCFLSNLTRIRYMRPSLRIPSQYVAQRVPDTHLLGWVQRTTLMVLFQCRTCVAVKELPMRTDVEIELIAHL